MKKFTIFFLCLLIFLSGMILAQERKLQVKKSITIYSPNINKNQFKSTDSILVSWTSVGIAGPLKASLHKHQQSEVRTYGQDLPLEGSRTVPASAITPGRYFIRLEEVNGNVKVDSIVFSVLPKLDKPEMVKKEPQTLEVTIPVQKRDRHSRKRQSENEGFQNWKMIHECPQQPTHGSQPSLARVGFENHFVRYTTFEYWYYTGYIFRSRLLFDVSQFVGKKGILLEAKLILKNTSTDSNYPDVNFCGQDLHVLTGVWELPVKCTDTPGYHYKRIHANATQSIDVVQQVRDWISGAEANHGFLFTGVQETWERNNLKCVSYYSAELYIKFREYQ